MTNRKILSVDAVRGENSQLTKVNLQLVKENLHKTGI
jgi:hypothetical protein